MMRSPKTHLSFFVCTQHLISLQVQEPDEIASSYVVVARRRRLLFFFFPLVNKTGPTIKEASRWLKSTQVGTVQQLKDRLRDFVSTQSLAGYRSISAV